MLMHPSVAVHKAHTGFPPSRAEPAVVTLQYDCGVAMDMPWTDWWTVWAMMHERHVVGLRVGSRVILTPLHYSQTLWGRA